MSDRIPSDHETISSVRVHVARVGRTDRLRIPLPEDVDLAGGDVIRLSLEGTTYHAQVRESLQGRPELRGAFDNARLARTTEDGTNHFIAWSDEVGLSADDPLLMDTITEGYEYGLRRPGERVIYEAATPPDSTLTDIARNLDG